MPRGLSRLTLAVLFAATTTLAGCFSPAPRRRRAPQPAPPLAKAVLRTARSYLPEEERHRRTPRDCSDFVRVVFAEHGMSLPRTSQEMSLLGERMTSSRDLRMGDLVFFSGEKVSRIVGHVGIYVNNGIFIHLPNTGQVVMESMYSDYYRRRYITSRRVINGDGD